MIEEKTNDVINQIKQIDDQLLQIQMIYEYIVEEPACYLKYYLGCLEIVSLKEAARTILGDSYSDLAFHTFLLDAGPAPFAILSDQLQQ